MNMTGPDFDRLLTAFRPTGTANLSKPNRMPFYEYFHDNEVVAAIMGEAVPSVKLSSPRELLEAYFRQRVNFMQRLGYDYVQCTIGPELTIQRLKGDDSAQLPRAKREWVDDNHGVIETWADFEAYPWPDLSSISLRPLEVCASQLVDGMKIVANPPGGVLENVMWLMGYMPMSYALVDQPGLVEAMFERCGEMIFKAVEIEAQSDAVGAVMLADDLGFRTGTLVHPDLLRKHCFPWYKKMAEVVHSHGKPFGLHACGNVSQVIEDLINVPFDAKHSFEDVIMPVTEFKRRYGSRIGVLGGIDVHLLASATEDEVRKYTRRVIEECAPGGGWALGSGNSLANYIPIKNFMAMLSAGAALSA
jgi:uroporphyrinogen decarboxylase